MADSSLRIVVGGFLGLLPAGGITWDYLQYPLGLAGLGHDVFYVEDTCLWPVYQSHDPGRTSSAANVEHLRRVMSAFGMADRWAYRDAVSGSTFGLGAADVEEVCRTADVFINVSCSTFLRDAYRRIPARLLIDTDPMFTQIQYETELGFTAGKTNMRSLVDGHTHHFTFGESVGRPGCRIPQIGVNWEATRQPVCLDHWPVTPVPRDSAAGFTTVMNWAAGRQLTYRGETWGQKDVEFRGVFELPDRVSPSLTVVVGQTGGSGEPFPSEEAAKAGWLVLNPAETTGDWLAYRDFIRRSLGEFSVAKETYVKARTGWFSCRSACYLASGRPVVTQDTTWSDHIPSGEGLIGFSTLREAAEALELIAGEPLRHGRTAREIAEEFFGSRKVLSELLRRAGAA